MPPHLPRKRAFASTCAYESDAENGYASGRTRRQRTSITTSVETFRAPIPLPGTKSKASRILKPACTGNQGTTTPAATTVATAVKAAPSRLSGIPRPVAFAAKNTRSLTASTKALSGGTKPSSSSLRVARAVELKENLGRQKNHGAVSDSHMDRLPSVPSPSKPRSVSKKSLEAIISDDKSLVTFPTSTSALVTAKSIPTLERPPLSLPAAPKRERRNLVKTLQQAYTDPSGCVHLAASDCQLFISFIHSPHHEVWDVPDDADISCPAFLYIMAKDMSDWDGVALSLPDVTLIDIQCRTKGQSPRFSNRHIALDNWECKFEGVEVPMSSGTTASAQLPSGTISIEMKWDRIYSIPATSNGSSLGAVSKHGDAMRAKHTRTLPSTKRGSLLFSKSSDEDSDDLVLEDSRPMIPGRGWRMKFWIPIPAYLFLRKETRTFEIDAEVHIVPGGDKRVINMALATQSISTRTEMTVSHLRKDREMDIFY